MLPDWGEIKIVIYKHQSLRQWRKQEHCEIDALSHLSTKLGTMSLTFEGEYFPFAWFSKSLLRGVLIGPRRRGRWGGKAKVVRRTSGTGWMWGDPGFEWLAQVQWKAFWGCGKRGRLLERRDQKTHPVEDRRLSSHQEEKTTITASVTEAAAAADYWQQVGEVYPKHKHFLAKSHIPGWERACPS